MVRYNNAHYDVQHHSTFLSISSCAYDREASLVAVETTVNGTKSLAILQEQIPTEGGCGENAVFKIYHYAKFLAWRNSKFHVVLT